MSVDEMEHEPITKDEAWMAEMPMEWQYRMLAFELRKALAHRQKARKASNTHSINHNDWMADCSERFVERLLWISPRLAKDTWFTED